MRKLKMSKKNMITSSVIIASILVLIIGLVYYSHDQSSFSGNLIQCYQETATVSNDCGGLSGGSYSSNINNDVYDGDWNNDGNLEHNGQLNIFTYEVPNNTEAVSFKVLMKDVGLEYLDIPNSCVNYNVTITAYENNDDDWIWECEANNGSQVGIYNAGSQGRKIRDEAIIWTIRQEVDCWTISNGICSNSPATYCSNGYQSISDCDLAVRLDNLNNSNNLQNDINDLRQQVNENENTLNQTIDNLTNTQTDVANNTAGVEQNRNSILSFFADLFNLGNRVDDNKAQTDMAIANLQNQTNLNLSNLSVIIQENKQRSQDNQETIGEILLSIFRLDGVLGNYCWSLDDNYCVRNLTQDNCSGYTTKRACQQDVTCWEIQGDSCKNSHDSNCAGFSTEAECNLNIPKTRVETVTRTIVENNNLPKDTVQFSTNNETYVANKTSFFEGVVNFWNGIWN